MALKAGQQRKRRPHEYATADLIDGLQKIREVLDWASDTSASRHNQLVWVKDSVDALLRGERVEMPKR